MEKAIPVGARIEKIRSKPEDTHRDGALGRVVEAIGPTPPDCQVPGVWGYFVEWNDFPGVKVFIAGTRIRPVFTD
jgi:hypothetical protein